MSVDQETREPVLSVDPRTGSVSATALRQSTDADVAAAVDAAHEAAAALAAMSRHDRAAMLDAAAESLQRAGEELVEVALRETGLPAARLQGEVARTVFQLRLFADAVREGSLLEATIDHAGTTTLGPVPDVRRMMVPLGPVAVFGASNFPLAFSVPGGDSASALAAGCPVVVKAHESHPLTSQLAFETLRDAVVGHGAPEGTVGLVFGREAGAALVADPRIRAVGFTGSAAGGRALLDIVNRREDPIPFYGELGSLNPLIVTPAAAAVRGPAIAEGLAGSVTGSGGQLCTKPGLALVPAGADGDALVAQLVSSVSATPASTMLNRGIAAAYGDVSSRLATEPGVELLGAGSTDPGVGPNTVPGTVLQVGAEHLAERVLEECFGPLVLVVRYTTIAELLAALERVPGSLTASLHLQPQETETAATLADALAARAGRLVFNGYPTGVRVSWGQHHGGPWPSTNSVHSSVGVTAVRRFLRPLAWQNAPQELLPEELRDGYDEVPRRVDGVLQVPRR